jgi:hypothetical protein
MAKYKRRAEWIWRPRASCGKTSVSMDTKFREEANRFVYLRKTFHLEDNPTTAMVDVSADGHYQLYVNGQRVGRGPARCSPDWQYYDTYDLRPYLRPGTNVVAALVRSYGKDFAWYELPRWEAAAAFGCGGWFLQGEATAGDGSVVRLDTDASWRCLSSPAWQQETSSGWVGYAEVFDARLAPRGWQEPDFEDGGWEAAQVLRAPGTWGGNDVVPFPVMVARDIPYLLEEMHYPVAVIKSGAVQNASGISSLEDTLQAETIGGHGACTIVGLDVLLSGAGAAEITTADGQSASIVFDFGRTEAGRIGFAVEGPAGAIVDIRYSEQARPDGEITVPPWSGGGNVYTHAHRVTLSEEPLQWEVFDYAGFRYLQMTVRNCSAPLRLSRVWSHFTSYPVGNRGKFACSDPLLDDIYHISAYTLQCCMHDSYEDCPSREQRQWTNDQFVHLMANYGLFGDPYLARKLLVQVAQSQRQDGQVMMCAPGDFSSINSFNMPEFTLHWILSIPQYVRHTGDASLIRQLYPNVVRGLEWFERHLDDEDLLDAVPGWLWIDWALVDKRGQLTEINARYVGCLRIAADFARRLDIHYDAERFDTLADRVSAAINLNLWDEARGVYVDTRRMGVQSLRVSQESNAAAIYFGIAPPERWPRILSYILDERRLRLTNALGDYRQDRDFDEEQQVVLGHAFYQHFLHAVLAKAGRHEDIVRNIRALWGPQAREGVSTWPESFVPEPPHTRCHAFMCTPGYDLPTYVLGVKPLAEGFSQFEVAPQPCGLTWANGVYPRAAGDIQVSWRGDGEAFELSVDVPAGTQAHLVLPERGGRLPRHVELDGEAVAPAGQWVTPGQHRLAGRY